MNEHHFKVQKTARVYTLGEVNQDTNEIVVVLHGYAMLAKYFINNFDSITNDNRVIVAPEGLSKFYWSGMNGKIRASWMTSEDRDNEIDDYTNYLTQIVNSFLTQTTNKPKITLIGFSQGAATAMRWATNTNININRIILWAGGFPKDCTKSYLSKFPNKTLEIVIGNNDEYINKNAIKKETEYLSQNNIKYSLTLFNGKHNIDSKTLLNAF